MAGNRHYNVNHYKTKKTNKWSPKRRLAPQVKKGQKKIIDHANMLKCSDPEYHTNKGDLPKLITGHKWVLSNEDEIKVSYFLTTSSTFHVFITFSCMMFSLKFVILFRQRKTSVF